MTKLEWQPEEDSVGNAVTRSPLGQRAFAPVRFYQSISQFRDEMDLRSYVVSPPKHLKLTQGRRKTSSTSDACVIVFCLNLSSYGECDTFHVRLF